MQLLARNVRKHGLKVGHPRLDAQMRVEWNAPKRRYIVRIFDYGESVASVYRECVNLDGVRRAVRWFTA